MVVGAKDMLRRSLSRDVGAASRCYTALREGPCRRVPPALVIAVAAAAAPTVALTTARPVSK